MTAQLIKMRVFLFLSCVIGASQGYFLHHPTSSGSPARHISRPTRPRGITNMGQWLHSKVVIEVPASPEDAYRLYSQLEEHPRWSPWLRSVTFTDPQNRISEWTLESKGVTVSWKAQNTIEEPGRRIQWESLTGLPNKGLVTFEEKATGLTSMELTISYSLPSAIAKVVGKVSFVQSYIESTLYGDLTRYKMMLLKDIRERRSKVVG